MGARAKRVISEIRRLKWPIGISILTIALVDTGIINPMSRWAVIAHKFSVITLAVILAHYTRSEIWPYIDLSEILASEDDMGRKIGACLLVGLFMAAVILGVALGL